jgi:hypothetical protein
MFFTSGLFTAEHVLSRMVTHSPALSELLYIIGFDLYAVSMTLVDAT